MSKNAIRRFGLASFGVDDPSKLEGRTSAQRLVRDDVVFKQVRDREAGLADAIRKVSLPPEDVRSKEIAEG